MNNSLTRREFIYGSAAAFLTMHMTRGENAIPLQKPNIIIINTDDLGYGDLGCYGNTEIQTPNIDKLAAGGMRFTQFYSAASLCTPSRAALLTGRYPFRSGMTQVLFPNSPLGLASNEITIATMLKKAGYNTGMIGKWHLGDKPEFLPTRHGFDEYYGIPYSNDMFFGAGDKPIPPFTLRNELPSGDTVTQRNFTELYTKESVRFIHQQTSETPFFLYLAHNAPHGPIAAPDGFEGKSKGGIYGDVVEGIDRSVGEVIAALKAKKLLNNTLIFFTSDNGAPTGWQNLPEKQKMRSKGGSNGSLRGAKASSFEGGLRVPLITYWPGKISPGTSCDAPTISMDLLPTCIAAAGGAPSVDRPLDGINILSLLLQEDTTPTERTLFFANAMRHGRWKFHLATPDRERLLFDLEADPGEQTNLVETHSEKANELEKLLLEMREQAPKIPLNDGKRWYEEIGRVK